MTATGDAWLNLRDVTLIDENFSGHTIDHLSFTNSRFIRCDFGNLRATDVSLAGGNEPSHFESCVFDGATLTMGTAGQATYVNCSFRNVRIAEWECRVVNLIDCTFSGALRNCSFDGRMPDDYRAYLGRDTNEIRGNDFIGAVLRRVYFLKGVDLSLQRLPTGPDYFFLADAAAAVAAARHMAAGWPPDEQAAAERFLKAFDRQIDGGQQQIFGRRADYTRGHGDLADRVMALWQDQSG